MPFDNESMPETIQVGFQEITIEEQFDDNNPNYGGLNWAEGRISIHINQSPAQAADTIIHEILHAIWKDRFPERSPDSEEEVIAGLSPGLSQVFYNNPDVIIWILLNLVGEKEWRNILKVQRSAKSRSSEKHQGKQKKRQAAPSQVKADISSTVSSNAAESSAKRST